MAFDDDTVIDEDTKIDEDLSFSKFVTNIVGSKKQGGKKMAFKGQPVETKTHGKRRAKVSDGKSVRVEVPEDKDIESQKFYLIDGFFGAAMQSADQDDDYVPDDIILNIEQAEFETDQTNSSQDYKVGTLLYWNDSDEKITESESDNRFVGIVTNEKDSDGVIHFLLAPQTPKNETNNDGGSDDE